MAANLRSLFTVFGTLLVSACVSTVVRQEPKTVDFILESYSALEGTTVQVTGYLMFGDDMSNLWNSKSAWRAVSGYVPSDSPLWNHCITLRGIGNHRSALLKQSGHLATITGLVSRVPLGGGEIEIGSCSEIGMSVVNVKGKQ
jgi:hypothetical protein